MEQAILKIKTLFFSFPPCSALKQFLLFSNQPPLSFFFCKSSLMRYGTTLYLMFPLCILLSVLSIVQRCICYILDIFHIHQHNILLSINKILISTSKKIYIWIFHLYIVVFRITIILDRSCFLIPNYMIR